VPNPAAGKTAFRTFVGITTSFAARRFDAQQKLKNDRVFRYNMAMADALLELALELFQKAYEQHKLGDLDFAVQLYKRSIEMCPTAEAYTFLGWTYHFQGKVDDAIAECKKAIELDPEYGNPYNDIGAYLIEKSQPDEAVEWLEKAITSRRYDAYHYAWYNLGRVYVAKEMYNKARECFEKARRIEPGYQPAIDGLNKLKMLLQ
jgi:tetratricopeptide (TPR) repeat protein